ncbi:hypothetical protein AB1Y20_018830 [Prymnesium parvum]|uniref:Aldehyde dehydrogenase domain-containing protein n=1 Tax=Prymnesium parvum TaxID=97485 RepID=A0AB34JPS4_PRYPA
MVQGVAIEGGAIVDVNPATGEEIARVPVSTPEEIDAAVAAAAAAQPAWAATPLSARIKRLSAVSRLLAEQHEELARLVTREMGKTIGEARAEVSGAADKAEFLCLVEQANLGAALVLREPHGVVAVCAPWNFPVDEILLLALPALAAGNALVLKPSEVAPLCGATVAAALRDALHAFPGVVGLVQGDGRVGAALVAHPRVGFVGMTGSSATGAAIAQAAGGALKRAVLELGGKDAMIVFADADLRLAARDAVANSLSNAGQVCCSVERVYVDAGVREQFEALVVAEARGYAAADGMDEAARMGPLVSRVQRAHVHAHVEAAVRAGARCLLGGELPAEEARGNFYPPTVLADVPQGCVAMREETFGPVVAMSAFDGGEESAVALANDSEYGLSACVYSEDIERAARVAARLHAGQVGINNWPLENAPLQCPWVGHKKSGFGFHSGADGWRQFSVPKSIIFNPGSELPQSIP